MRRVTDMPTSYAQAASLLGRDEYAGRTIANNTRVKRTGTRSVALILHGTAIITWHDDDEQSITLSSGGYETVTTKARMNAALDTTRYRVFQQAHRWYVWDRVLDVNLTFEDGMVLNLNRDCVPR